MSNSKHSPCRTDPSSYSCAPHLNMSAAQLFEAMQACFDGVPSPSVSSVRFRIVVTFVHPFRSISDTHRVQSIVALALMYYILRSRSFVHYTLGINSKLSMVCLFTVCFREFSAMLRCTQVQCRHLELVKCTTACL